MSPVQQSKARSSRSVVLAVAGLVVGLVLIIVLFFVAIPSLSESGTIEVKLGDTTFDAGPADSRARSIAADGPFLFSDVSGGKRDIYLQHQGDDPAVGWTAFDARRPGQGRDCPLDWISEESQFRDRCDKTLVPADGRGVPSYPVTVTDAGRVVVDLNPDDPAADTTGDS